MKRSPQTFPVNMLTNANKGIDAVTYNRLHRPETVQVGGNTFGFTYDAAGNMLQRTYYHPMATLNPAGGATLLSLDLDPGTPSLQTATDTLSYCGPFEYKNGRLSRVNFPGGYVSGATAYHYIHDHQGNVRQVVDAATGARMYDPALLRFITPDPLRHQTPHLPSYLYCAANPVMLVDPTGMKFN